MKNITEFLTEAQKNVKEFSFTFDDIDNADDVLKSIKKIASDKKLKANTAGKTIKITVSPSDISKLDPIIDIIQQTLDAAEDANELELTDQMNDLNDWIDEVNETYLDW